MIQLQLSQSRVQCPLKVFSEKRRSGMTRLSSELLTGIDVELDIYDKELLRKTGSTLRQIAVSYTHLTLPTTPYV